MDSKPVDSQFTAGQEKDPKGETATSAAISNYAKAVCSPADSKCHKILPKPIKFEQIFESLKIDSKKCEESLTKDDSGLGAELRSVSDSCTKSEKSPQDVTNQLFVLPQWNKAVRKLDLNKEMCVAAQTAQESQQVRVVPRSKGVYGGCRFSRKVFVGGLPSDASERDISLSFSKFGLHTIDWPYRRIDGSCYPPKGYCFLLFNSEVSVRKLMECCIKENERYYWHFNSSTVVNKVVQIRPWMIMDSEYIDRNFFESCTINANNLDNDPAQNDISTGQQHSEDKTSSTFNNPDKAQMMTRKLHPRNMIFVGGIPRPTKAKALAAALMKSFGPVLYTAIDTDAEFNYPKGAGKVLFKEKSSYLRAIKERFVSIEIGEHEKRIELKPFILESQPCDLCGVLPHMHNKYHQQQPYQNDTDEAKIWTQQVNSQRALSASRRIVTAFCPALGCLKYYCQSCWRVEHSKLKGNYSAEHCPTVRDVYSGTFIREVNTLPVAFPVHTKMEPWQMLDYQQLRAPEDPTKYFNYPPSGFVDFTGCLDGCETPTTLYEEPVDMKIMEKFDLKQI